MALEGKKSIILLKWSQAQAEAMGKVFNSVSSELGVWHTAGAVLCSWYCPSSGCRSPAGGNEYDPQAGGSRSEGVSLGLQQPWEEKLGLSLTPSTAYVKGIKDMENS